MIVAYRFIPTVYAKSGFDGVGPRLYGGRWNSKGQSCVYVGERQSLCVLETMVHLNSYADLFAFSMLSIELPDDEITDLDLDFLPPDWRQDPAPASTKRIGDEWLAGGSSLALRIPSTIVQEANFLININHPAFVAASISIREVSFSIDPRLVK
jgi:RES domain-containing protein